MSSEGFYYNGTKLDNTSSNTFTNSLSATIFAIKQANNPTQVLNRNPVMKLYSCKIWENNILVNNFIPCYRISDNVIGMYDVVGKQFYTNAGSGTFTKGNNAPTPDTPIDIEVVTGTQEVKVENVNLLENEFTNGTTPNNVTLTIQEDKKIQLSGTANADGGTSYTLTQPIKLNKNQAYILSVGQKQSGIGIYLQTSNGTNIVFLGVSSTSTSITYTPTEDIEVGKTALHFLNGTTLNTTIYLQLEKGSTATPYTPHQEQTQTLSLGDIELCKIGNYQDYLYKSGNKWYKKEQIGKYTFTGNEGWVYDSNNTRFNVNNVVHYANLEGRQQVYCNNFKYLSTGSGSYGIFGHYNSGYNTTFIYDTDYTSADNFKTWLASHNTYMYYITSTPQDIEITNETLIEQLNNLLEKMKSYNGTTNISSSGNLPIVLGVSALKGE